jgi:hypothetical protein
MRSLETLVNAVTGIPANGEANIRTCTSPLLPLVTITIFMAA